MLFGTPNLLSFHSFIVVFCYTCIIVDNSDPATNANCDKGSYIEETA